MKLARVETCISRRNTMFDVYDRNLFSQLSPRGDFVFSVGLYVL
jgi:hypothetical protein